MLIIAFAGMAGSGKTTAQKYLQAKLPNVIPITIAEPLKVLTKKIYNLSDQQIYGSLEEKESMDYRYHKSPRQLMQDLGWYFREVFGEDFWVEQAMQKIFAIETTPPFEDRIYVLDDVRYFNEVSYLKKHSAYLVRLACPSHRSKHHEHVSEAEIGLVPKFYFNKQITCINSTSALLLKSFLEPIIDDIISGECENELAFQNGVV